MNYVREFDLFIDTAQSAGLQNIKTASLLSRKTLLTSIVDMT